MDLVSFLVPGSSIGTIAQRVCEYLSVQDLIEYIASISSRREQTPKGAEDPSSNPDPTPSNPKFVLETESYRKRVPVGRGCVGGLWKPEGWQTGESHLVEMITQGGGDEAGGGARTLSRHWATPNYCGAVIRQQSSSAHLNGKASVDQGNERHSCTLEDFSCQSKGKDNGLNIIGLLIGLSMQPWAALGAIGGGVSHLLSSLPLLTLLRWAAGGAASVLGVTFRVALLPYGVIRSVVSHVVGALEAMLDVATEIWYELRHLSLNELACVVSCVVSGNSIPEYLIPPTSGNGEPRSDSNSRMGSGSVDAGRSGGFGLGQLPGRIHSRSPAGSGGLSDSADGAREGSTIGDEGGGVAGRTRVLSSRQPEDPRGGASGSRGAWRQAHALRRRLDRVNRTASLVSYEERSDGTVSRAKAERVRRRMHYAMSLQCFQATVTVDGQGSPMTYDCSGDDDSIGGDNRGVMNSVGSFMCTPQSFPPTPVSRAHVMARTSQFSDDILFLARDQLRLGENLKPGVDETTRATADFLRRQQRLAVLDGNNACADITLSCGHHRATKVGPALYSSVRAMVPVLRNRHVYFQVSCKRNGPLAPCVGVGLSTPEMPLSTLVGAFSNSVGLCSTGQILMSSRWYGSPGEYAVRKGCMSTVGVLVYLDGARSFRSWDGEMVRAFVCFSIDGHLVRVSTAYHQGLPSAMGLAEANAGRSTPFPSTPVRQQLVPEGFDTPRAASPLSFVEEYLLSAATPAAGDEAHTISACELTRHNVSEAEISVVEEVVPWESAANAAVFTAPSKSRLADCAGQGSDFGAMGAHAHGRSMMTDKDNVASVAERNTNISAALGLALPRDRDLFPTVTMHSADTEVFCRFCAEDLLPASRESIGAPPHVAIYALDGSLINLP